MRSILAFLFGASVMAASHADVLWGKAESGASVSAIAGLYPEGAEVEPTEKHRLNSGAVMRFKVPKLEIAGKDFEVAFYFLDDKLTQVGLSHKSSESTSGCEDTLNNLQEVLRAKYGVELTNSRSRSLGVTRSASWSSGKTTIGLNMYAYETPSCSLYLTYSERIAGMADKL